MGGGGGGGGGVRKTIIVDLTSGRRPRWVARYEKWMALGGGCCECPLETILPNFGLGRSPNSFALFKSLSHSIAL